MTNWRAVVEAAIADGDAAEGRISERDLAALLKIPAEQRLRDSRVSSLRPSDLEKLRESLSGSQGRQDDGKARAARQRQILTAYVDGYVCALEDEASRLATALKPFFFDPGSAAAGIVADMIAQPPPPIAVYGVGQFGRMRSRWFRRWPPEQLRDAHAALQRAARISHALHAARRDIAALPKE